eukprot:TRINITY_DN25475_c0_g1_i1.p1 TRINITY_DN25475_c0_g1~~TRINITY_DN25475_c0_g1_i1.p1  ORF type:complete len:221 (+),score=13.64 TRINITY_DN25475_c0_g1_i1:81-743(+)
MLRTALCLMALSSASSEDIADKTDSTASETSKQAAPPLPEMWSCRGKIPMAQESCSFIHSPQQCASFDQCFVYVPGAAKRPAAPFPPNYPGDIGPPPMIPGAQPVYPAPTYPGFGYPGFGSPAPGYGTPVPGAPIAGYPSTVPADGGYTGYSYPAATQPCAMVPCPAESASALGVRMVASTQSPGVVPVFLFACVLVVASLAVIFSYVRRSGLQEPLLDC